ncbi:arginine--tRNA ligase [Caldivirga sp. UBA161]|uniref:arginine--tRNA ligase n=1 Tax=Caldivirga sp. UBA161 TaxID=1915569 RepID=UPI0025C70027|nr:arginine--tRNA ligase [Caldivirga sp. UBA161]
MEYNPYRALVNEFKDIAAKLTGVEDLQVIRARAGFGYLSIPLHDLIRSRPNLSSEINEGIRGVKAHYLVDLRFINGFLNANVNLINYGKLVLDSTIGLGPNYGKVPDLRRLNIIVEHTSANPLHPLHIGHCRNMVLGDSLVRLLRFMGHNASARFYLDDTGIQVMYLALGYSKVKELVRRRIESSQKPDHVMWIIYSVTNAIAEVQRITKALEGKGEEEYRELIKERDEWVGVIADWLSRDKELVNTLVESLSSIDVNAEVARMAKAYEDGDEGVKGIVREAVNLVLKGFEETFKLFNVKFDAYDWESEIAIYSGLAKRIIMNLAKAAPGYVEFKDGVYVFRADKAAADLKLWDELKLPKFIPPATLNRSDGTTLYLTRDVAYAVWCLTNCNPDAVIRVIAVEQTHPQAQLRIILKLLGYDASRIVHYAYEMVNLGDAKMSSRRGQAVTIDGLLDDAVKRVKAIASGRGGLNTDDVAYAVAVGAIRYYFVSVSPSKQIVFDWGRVLDMNQNSGPFIQYTYVRAHSILSKANLEPTQYIVPSGLSPEEGNLILMIGEFPEVLLRVSEDLKLENLVSFINRLALEFNTFYEKYPVINAEPGLREFRLALVKAVKIVLENSMGILGIPVLSRM